MNSQELYDLFRKDVVDTAKPYLWSDDEVYAYMNDAYFMFVRRTGGIIDSSSAVTQVVAQQGEPFSTLDSRILHVKGAYRLSDQRKVDVINYEDIEHLAVQDFGLNMPIKLDLTQGKVLAMVLGMEYDKVRWFKVPDADETVQLTVFRLPTTPIVNDGQTYEFIGVHEHHHFHLLKWMRHLAYGKQDAETFDRERSDRAEREFLAYCDQARLEYERYKHKPRSMGYGGI